MATRSTWLEHLVLSVLTALTVIGVGLALYDAQLFRDYTREVGVIENCTVMSLLAGAVVCFRRVRRLRGRRSRLFVTCTALLGLLYVAAAGEELSWGQHFLKFKAPEFFQQHNAQRETNLHNLVLQGVRLNRVVFGTALYVAIVAYCTILPVGYRWWPSIRRMVGALAVPVPRTRHIAWFAALTFTAAATPSRYRWEVIELVNATMFLLFTVLPLNAAAFQVEPDTPPRGTSRG